MSRIVFCHADDEELVRVAMAAAGGPTPEVKIENWVPRGTIKVMDRDYYEQQIANEDYLVQQRMILDE